MPRHSTPRVSRSKSDEVGEKIQQEIRTIELEIARLETQLNGRRQELADARNAFKWVTRVNDSKGASTSKASTDRRGRGNAKRSVPPVDPAPEPKAKPPESMAAVIREIVMQQTGEFTVTNIMADLRKQHPDVAARLPANYCGIQLWKLGGNGTLTVVRRGEKGLANVYALPTR